MTRFRLDLAYDGTDFEGWQAQVRDGAPGSNRTVQGELERVLHQILKKPCPVVGAGRTDSGVHARAQTAHFDAETRMDGSNFVRALNSLLPADIRAIHCSVVDPSFHARFSALARVYHYHILPTPLVMPWEHRYVHAAVALPPVQSLNAMACQLQGELDFTSFAHAKDPSESKFRYIYHAAFFPQGDQIVFRIVGNAFLWRMVRSLVGTLLDLGQKGAGPAEFRNILESRDRRRAGTTAPAQGLFLQKVIYDASEFAF